MLTRRSFTSKGFLFVLSGLFTLNLPGCSKEEKNVKLKKILLEKDFIPVFESDALEKFSIRQGRSADHLIDSIFQRKLPNTKAEVMDILRDRAKSDFASGNTVQIDGWVFSKSIADFSALQHLLISETSIFQRLL